MVMVVSMATPGSWTSNEGSLEETGNPEGIVCSLFFRGQTNAEAAFAQHL
jgi:hypothetical protein